MSVQRYVVFLLSVVLIGCAAKDPQLSFDKELYDGQSVENFDQSSAPKTEKEAIERGDKALGENNLDLALYEYIRSLVLPNGEYKDRTLYTIGRIHQSRDNLVLAERAYLKALEFNPNNIQVLEQLGSNFSKKGDVVQGESYFLRAINADQLRLRTNIMVMREPLSPALVDSLGVDAMSPKLAYVGLGILYDIDASHTLAQAFYNKALMIEPDDAQTLLNMGYSYYMSGDYEKAEQTTLAVLKESSNNTKAKNNLALIYLAENRIQKALSTFKTHMKAPEALNNIGYFLILQGKPEQAVPYLQQAIDESPTYYKLANDNLERALSEIRMIKGNN